MVLLQACEATTDKERPPKREPAPEPLSGPECDPAVVVPSALATTAEPPAPDPHQEVFGPKPEPFAVRYGWPSSDPSTSASFLWRTGVDTLATVLEYGAGGELNERVEGASFRFSGPATGPGDHRIHEVKLCAGLQPGTTYSYRVGGNGHFSPVYEFTTPPAPGTFDTFRIAMAGDSRGAYETWGTVFATMESYDPDFYLFSGDMVEFGTLQEEWDSWFAAMGDVPASKALVPAHGNHEFLATNYFAQFSLPNNEEWFSIRYGDLHLVSLNDTVRELEHRDAVQPEYLHEVLGATDAHWRFAMHHQAAYSTSTRHGSDESVRAAWVPELEEHGVQLVFAGHNHLYERSVPIHGGQEAAPGEGTVYIVSGGAGAPLYDGVAPDWFSNVANPVEHFVIADFGPAGVDFVVRDLSGNVIDEFSLVR